MTMEDVTPLPDQASTGWSGPYSAGMELAEPARFTPPETRPGPAAWQPWYGPRFSLRTRVGIGVIVTALPALLAFAACYQLLAGEGRERAAAVILLFPLVPLVPLLVWLHRDLWLPRR
jgi:hypothetical protein